MTITVTKPSANQWGKVGKVILYLAISAACAVLTAYLSNNPAWLASMPGWNVLGVIIEQFLQQEESNALTNVPEDVKTAVAKVAPEVVSPQTPVASDPTPTAEAPSAPVAS